MSAKIRKEWRGLKVFERQGSLDCRTPRYFVAACEACPPIVTSGKYGVAVRRMKEIGKMGLEFNAAR